MGILARVGVFIGEYVAHAQVYAYAYTHVHVHAYIWKWPIAHAHALGAFDFPLSAFILR